MAIKDYLYSHLLELVKQHESCLTTYESLSVPKKSVDTRKRENYVANLGIPASMYKAAIKSQTDAIPVDNIKAMLEFQRSVLETEIKKTVKQIQAL